MGGIGDLHLLTSAVLTTILLIVITDRDSRFKQFANILLTYGTTSLRVDRWGCKMIFGEGDFWVCGSKHQTHRRRDADTLARQRLGGAAVALFLPNAGLEQHGWACRAGIVGCSNVCEHGAHKWRAVGNHRLRSDTGLLPALCDIGQICRRHIQHDKGCKEGEEGAWHALHAVTNLKHFYYYFAL